MKKLLWLLVCLGLLAGANAAWADDSPYQANVPVASQSQNDWLNGIQQGLAQVLVRATGSDAILKNRKIKTQLTQVNSYVQSFSYITNPATQGTGPNNLILQIQFYPQAIQQLIQTAGAPVRTTQQPATLVWLAVKNPPKNDLEIVNSQTKDSYADSLNINAQRRGFAILLPMMDLQDMQAATKMDVWALNSDSLYQASQRYSTSSILVAKIYQDKNDSNWRAEWVYMNDKKDNHDSAKGNSADNVISTMLDKISMKTIAQQSHQSSHSNTVTLRVTNVNGLDDYAAVVSYLRGLKPVTDATVANVENNDLLIQVTVNGDVNVLSDAIANENTLQPLANNGANELDYRWNSSNAPANPTTANPPTKTSAADDNDNNNDQDNNDDDNNNDDDSGDQSQAPQPPDNAPNSTEAAAGQTNY